MMRTTPKRPLKSRLTSAQSALPALFVMVALFFAQAVQL